MDACFLDVTIEFLAVAFHNILYYASVYPKSIFETRTKYNVVVFQCVHPEVKEYIDMTLKSIAEILKSDQLHRVEFAVTDKCLKPELKVVFDFDRSASFDDTADAYLVRCEQNLRAFCLQLTTVSHKFKNLSEECSFAIYLYTNESTEVATTINPELEEFPLIQVEEEQNKSTHHIIPLRSFPIRNYSIDTYLELSQT